MRDRREGKFVDKEKGAAICTAGAEPREALLHGFLQNHLGEAGGIRRKGHQEQEKQE